MSIQIKVFGQLSEIAGNTELELNELLDTDQIREQLLSDFPKLEQHPFVMAVNKKIIKQNQKLNEGDEVALLPPFAGG